MGTLHDHLYKCFYHTSLNCAMDETFSDKFVQKTKIHILCSNLFFKLCLFMIQCGKNYTAGQATDMTIWRMCTACWIPKAANAHPEYVKTLIAFITATMGARKRLIVASYLHCLFS
jgi:hypothetical protein